MPDAMHFLQHAEYNTITLSPNTAARAVMNMHEWIVLRSHPRRVRNAQQHSRQGICLSHTVWYGVLQIGRALLEAVSLSTAAELQRRVQAAASAGAPMDTDGQGNVPQRCADMCRTAKTLIAEEQRWTR